MDRSEPGNVVALEGRNALGEHRASAELHELLERFFEPLTAPDQKVEALAHDGPTLVDIISQPLHEAAAPVSEWVA